ncbi:MAG: DUF433 domain-containing protein [Bacteroidota bacterium]
MNRSPLLERITINPEVCHGKPTIRNKRYMVSSMLGYLAAGETFESMLEEFEDLEQEDLLACLAYAALTVDLKEIAVYPVAA